MNGEIKAADLFCGAGIASLGLSRACRAAGYKLNLVAVNHWPVAVQTHSANHPAAVHLCEDLESVNPRKVVPGGRLDVLLAGPECTHHSTARGGRPVNDQSRASAWCILRWATALTIDRILIENVREFLTWGPLGSTGRPLKSRKGETFRAFIDALKSLGYRVEWRVLNAADYGDPTTRQRLFIQAARGRRPIRWPEPTHAREPGRTLFGSVDRWRPAREVIDWSIPGESIFRRKRPLAQSTLARIAAGLRKFCGALAEPFLVLLNGGGCRGEGGCRSIERPLAHHYRRRRPLPTITTVDAWGLVEPYLVRYHNNRPEVCARSLDEPLPVADCNDRYGLVCPAVKDYLLDIRFRMLQPSELAAAMSIPPDYILHGTREQKVKQIGNAWPARLSEQLCRQLLPEGVPA